MILAYSVSLYNQLGYLFLMGLGFEIRALHLQSKHSTALAIPPIHFILVILEMRGVL
jgi:hypothetical protein